MPLLTITPSLLYYRQQLNKHLMHSHSQKTGRSANKSQPSTSPVQVSKVDISSSLTLSGDSNLFEDSMCSLPEYVFSSQEESNEIKSERR